MFNELIVVEQLSLVATNNVTILHNFLWMTPALCAYWSIRLLAEQKLRTPLHFAANVADDGDEERTKKVRVFKLLCQNGADPFLKDKVCTIISLRTAFIQLSFSQFSFYNLSLV